MTMTTAEIFTDRFGEFYYPENRDDDEKYTFTEIADLCTEEFLTSEELQHQFPNVEALTLRVVESIEWEHPSTNIDQMKHFD